MATKPKTLVLRTAGTNCDGETVHAFERAGATVELVHINRLLKDPRLLDAYQLLAIPGGFSYGDDIAAGRILANQIAHHLADAMRGFVDSGRPVIGICNGFQVLVKTELLPGALGGRSGQNCTLAHNACGRFIDRWISLRPRESRCVWTRGLGEAVVDLPIAHGEGRFVPADEQVRRELWSNEQVALTYACPDGNPAGGAFPENPNGSVDDIAGVCDPSGLVFGLMPHPERYVDAIQHPAWTRQRAAGVLAAEGQGLRFFRNAVEHVTQAVGAGV
jgi:phosphoribosylformylglycinamidine synthase